MTDWIEGYKLGFKEGVEAVRIQLKERLIHYGETEYTFDFDGVTEEDIDEICKELEDE